jgi:ribonuclease HI
MAINEGFNVTPSGMLVAYCDGSARGNGQKGSKAGLGVYWGSDGEAEKRSVSVTFVKVSGRLNEKMGRRNLAEPVPGIMQTNNRGELLVSLLP